MIRDIRAITGSNIMRDGSVSWVDVDGAHRARGRALAALSEKGSDTLQGPHARNPFRCLPVHASPRNIGASKTRRKGQAPCAFWSSRTNPRWGASCALRWKARAMPIDLATDGEDGHYLGSTENLRRHHPRSWPAGGGRPDRARPLAQGRQGHARARAHRARQLVGQGGRPRRRRRRLSGQTLPDRGTDRTAARADPPRRPAMPRPS